MPNQGKNTRSGLIVVLKPMPKQVKEGGINPTFDLRALRLSKQRSGAAICRPAAYFFFISRALTTSGKPALICTQKVGLFSNGIV